MLIQKEKLGIDGEKVAHISSPKIVTKIRLPVVDLLLIINHVKLK